MIIAWRVLFVTMLGRECPELPCTVLFEDDEWKSVYVIAKNAPPPETPPLLGEFTLMIASLGGYLNPAEVRRPARPQNHVGWLAANGRLCIGLESFWSDAIGNTEGEKGNGKRCV